MSFPSPIRNAGFLRSLFAWFIVLFPTHVRTQFLHAKISIRICEWERRKDKEEKEKGREERN